MKIFLTLSLHNIHHDFMWKPQIFQENKMKENHEINIKYFN